MEKRRLDFEIVEMRRIFPEAKLFKDKDKDNSVYWEISYKGHRINVFYNPGYPFSPAQIYISPALRTHHHHEDLSLCWQRGGEWNPSWTAVTVVGKAIQFISDYKAGRIRE